MVARPIPEELRSFSKNETNFFWEKIPSVLKEDADDFFKLFSLYLEGVISMTGFSELCEDMFTKRGEEDVLKTLQNYASLRDHSRRDKNMLLKPLCELEFSQLKKTDSPSYYPVPPDFPLPICTGRYAQPILTKTLNDKYCSSTIGTEYKSKLKNPYVDALIKNEDDMYEVDHGIIQFESCKKNIQKEMDRCETMTEAELTHGVYLPKYLSPANFEIIKE
jgi:histone deacetylase complex regulatory component SIN3